MFSSVSCVLADVSAKHAAFTPATLTGSWPDDLDGFALQCAALQPGTSDTFVGVLTTTVDSAAVVDAVHMEWLPLPLQTVLLRSSAVKVALLAFESASTTPSFWFRASCAESAPALYRVRIWSAAHWETVLQQWAPLSAHDFVKTCLQTQAETVLRNRELCSAVGTHHELDDEDVEYMSVPPTFISVSADAAHTAANTDSEEEEVSDVNTDGGDAHDDSDDAENADNVEDAEEDEDGDNAEADEIENIEEEEHDDGTDEDDDLDTDTDDSDDDDAMAA